MKVNLVKDASGRVIATFENGSASGPSLRPELQPGHTVEVVDAAENYKADIDTFYKQNSR
ncbi:hypothetical protein AAHK20_23360 [Trinickia sp. YCB016]